MKENYYALLICILKPITIEQSFNMMNGVIDTIVNTSVTKSDIRDMMHMKNNMTYEEIGKLYGLTKQAVYRRIKRFKDKEAKAV